MASKKYEFPSFSSRLQKADDKFRDKNINKLLKQAAEWNIEGLDEIIKEILNLKEESYYKKLHDAYKVRNKFYTTDAPLNDVEALNVRILRLGFENLSHIPIYLPPLTNLIDPKMPAVIYTFFECVYYTNIKRLLEREDIEKIYFSGLDERITFALDKFDEISDVPEPTAEYFQKLKKLKWKSKKSKKIFKRLESVRTDIGDSIFGLRPITFPATEQAFLMFLSGCSAVNNNRDEINETDIVTAYKTYFKLMKTDLTKYEAKEELLTWKAQSGHLICEQCGGYYRLKAGENPEDFECCQCGGELTYYDIDEFTLKKAMKEGWNAGKNSVMR